jgi:L-serine dehydratase
MMAVSILNEVLGPVMRGPSSSHTAAPFYIGVLARALLGDEPAAATFRFDPGGSFAEVYQQQSSDLGFAAGLMGWLLTDERFDRALEVAAAEGLDLAFHVEPLAEADHPNTVRIEMAGRNGQELALVANSIGGGALVVRQVAGWPVHLAGDVYEVLVEVDVEAEERIQALLESDGETIEIRRQERPARVLLHARRREALAPVAEAGLAGSPGVMQLWTAPPVFHGQQGEPLFEDGAGMVALAEETGKSLGEVALAYEAALLGLPQRRILAEVVRRYRIMRAAVLEGLAGAPPSMQLLRPSAAKIYRAEAEGRVAVGGIHTRAAARAMAVMHVNGGMGVVCAAPTAGSAGTIPGVAVTLGEDLRLSEDRLALALLAAAGVGLVVAMRATFAAEVAGCQVEIGAAGAMAAAAVVEAAGGSARQAADAAAIAFQNTMGSVCDLVQGIVEVPCHTRNAAAASSAFVCADLIMGGYENPIPLDETVDAVFAVGQMLPRELKVTSLGGLAMTPSARAMPRLR